MKQPEALCIADWLEHRTNIMMQDQQTAAELRRLHALNQELLEVLNTLTEMAATFPNELHREHPDVLAALAAITKAEEQMK